MLLVSVLPLGLYHRQVLQLSQTKLTDTESVQQTEVTRSVAEEVQLFDTNLYQQLISERQILALTDLIDKVEDSRWLRIRLSARHCNALSPFVCNP
jgi:hypothetical protein